MIPDDARPACHALVRLIETMSEEAWSAGWMMGIEYDLWAIVVGDARPDYYRPDDIAALRWLSEQCGGWATCGDGDGGDGYVPLDQWKRQYAAYVADAGAR